MCATGNWIQNTRQPYYSSIPAGDSDVLRGILRYFNRSMAVARARVRATMGIGGVFWPETSTPWGTYDAAGLGYGCNGSGPAVQPALSPFLTAKDDRRGAGPTVPAVNGYTRFYSSGSLEVCFLGLEEFDASVRPSAFFGRESRLVVSKRPKPSVGQPQADAETLRTLTLPICDGVLQFYRERFPRLNASTGKTDLFPSQVIESFWCGNGGEGTNAWGHRGADGKMPGANGSEGRPYGRGECPTNGAPDVAGLRAVLSRLLSLPPSLLQAEPAWPTAQWQASLGALPPLETEVCHFGGQQPPPHGPPDGGPCRTCSPNHNSSTCWCNGHTPCAPPTGSEPVVAIAAAPWIRGIRQHNHENHALYAVWPFRQFAAGKPGLEIGRATYRHRPHPCNHNW